MADQSEEDTEARVSSTERYTPGEAVAGCVAEAIIWSFRWAFFGAVLALLVLASLVLLLRPEFHSNENFTVACFLGAAIGWVTGAFGGAIHGWAGKGKEEEVAADTTCDWPDREA